MKKLVFFFAIMLTTTSCVSKKMYLDSQNRENALKSELDACQEENKNLISHTNSVSKDLDICNSELMHERNNVKSLEQFFELLTNSDN